MLDVIWYRQKKWEQLAHSSSCKCTWWEQRDPLLWNKVLQKNQDYLDIFSMAREKWGQLDKQWLRLCPAPKLDQWGLMWHCWSPLGCTGGICTGPTPDSAKCCVCSLGRVAHISFFGNTKGLGALLYLPSPTAQHAVGFLLLAGSKFFSTATAVFGPLLVYLQRPVLNGMIPYCTWLGKGFLSRGKE